ncbi:MAG TPA: DUF5069 domain-containing protein [Chthoniobacterales bacterium]
MSTNLFSPDLTLRPPRSPRLRLGGFVILPRALDKGRAKLAGRIGEYHFNCPLDKRFLSFVKIEGDALLAELAAGKGDGEILAWIFENAGHKPFPWEITQWSAFQESLGPDTVQAKERFARQLAEQAPDRGDILTGFDRLDLDDYLTFGGKA